MHNLTSSYLVGSLLPTGSILHSPPGELPHAEFEWLWWRELQFWICNQPILMFWGAEQTDDTLIWNLSSLIWSLVLNYFITKGAENEEWSKVSKVSHIGIRGKRKWKHLFRFHPPSVFCQHWNCALQVNGEKGIKSTVFPISSVWAVSTWHTCMWDILDL